MSAGAWALSHVLRSEAGHSATGSGVLAVGSLTEVALVLVVFAIGMAADAGIPLFVIVLTPFEQVVHHLVVAFDSIALF